VLLEEDVAQRVRETKTHLGRNSRPTMASSTLLLPLLWLPTTTIEGSVSPASSPILNRIERISMSLRVRSMRSSLESTAGSSASTSTGTDAAMAAARVAAGVGSDEGPLPGPPWLDAADEAARSAAPSRCSASSSRSNASRKRSRSLERRDSTPTVAPAHKVEAVSETESIVSPPCWVSEWKVEAIEVEARP